MTDDRQQCEKHPVAIVSDWINSQGVEVGRHVDVFYSDRYGSVQITTKQYMNKRQYNRFVTVMKNAEFVRYDPDKQRNYVLMDDVPEVPTDD